MQKFDKSFNINENVLNEMKSLFGFGVIEIYMSG